MDIAWHLKDNVLYCKECQHPFKLVEENGDLSYTICCIVCERKYELKLELKEKT